MVMNKALTYKRGIMPDNACKCSQVLGDLRIAFMWHGNTTDGSGDETLTDFTDFCALQVIHFVPYFIAGGSNKCEQVKPLDQGITRSCP